MPDTFKKKLYPDDPLIVSIEGLFNTVGPKEKIKRELWEMFRDSLDSADLHRPQERADLFHCLCELVDASEELA